MENDIRFNSYQVTFISQILPLLLFPKTTELFDSSIVYLAAEAFRVHYLHAIVTTRSFRLAKKEMTE